jgi:RecB family exonuclease
VLNLYNQCEYAFYLKYILKYKQEIHNNSIYGEVIHSLFKIEIDKLLYPNFDFSEFNDYEYRGYYFDSKNEKLMENKEILQMAVDDFVDEFLENISTLKIKETIKKYDIECEKTFSFGDFNGSIDVLGINKNKKEAYILDYKTGKSVYASFYQLELYASIIFMLYPNIKTIYLNLYFVPENKLKKRKILREEAELSWYETKQKIDRIKKQKEFKKNLAFCKNCIMEESCKAEIEKEKVLEKK